MVDTPYICVTFALLQELALEEERSPTLRLNLDWLALDASASRCYPTDAGKYQQTPVNNNHKYLRLPNTRLLSAFDHSQPIPEEHIAFQLTQCQEHKLQSGRKPRT